MNIGGTVRDLEDPRRSRRSWNRLKECSAACAAERAPGLVELRVDLVLEEHDCRDDREGDPGDEEDVLHHAGAGFVLAELRLEPCTQHEQIHGMSLSATPRSGIRFCTVREPSARSVTGLSTHCANSWRCSIRHS